MFAEGTSTPEHLPVTNHSLENPKGLGSLPQISIVKPPEIKISLPDSRLTEPLMTINICSKLQPEDITADNTDRLNKIFSTNFDLFKNALRNPYGYSRTLEAVNNMLVYANRFSSDNIINLPEAERKKLVNLSDTVVSFITQNIDKVELGMKNTSLDGKINAFRAVSISLESLPLSFLKEEQDALYGFLLKHFESVLRQTQMTNRLSGNDKNGSTATLRRALAQISKYQFAHHKDNDLDEMLIKMANGLNANRINEWRSSTESKDMHNAIARNFMSVLELESQRPGITSTLNKEFGISCFGRYPQDLLIAQYDDKHKKEMPYGVIINTKADYNGAFYCNSETYAKLFSQLNGRYRIRVFEVNSLLEIVHALNRSRHKYGKTSFAIVGAHGSENRIQFGTKFLLKKSYLHTEDLKRKGANALQLAFVENPAIILVSCSTGALGGIGEEMSNLGATVIAPPTPTSLRDIEVQYDEQGHPKFNVTYSSDEKGRVPSHVYQKGTLKSEI